MLCAAAGRGEEQREQDGADHPPAPSSVDEFGAVLHQSPTRA
jgi:hypothetical protein